MRVTEVKLFCSDVVIFEIACNVVWCKAREVYGQNPHRFSTMASVEFAEFKIVGRVCILGTISISFCKNGLEGEWVLVLWDIFGLLEFWNNEPSEP